MPPAITITVDTAADTSDPNDGFTSLREAINFANANAGTTIKFANTLAGQTITVGSSGLNELPLILGDNTVIDGGNNNITVSGDNTYRVFVIGDAGQIPDAPGNLGQGVTHATIEHLTIAHANAKGGDGGGGGAGLGGALFVSSKGSLTLSDVVLASNAAAGGAGGITGAGGGM